MIQYIHPDEELESFRGTIDQLIGQNVAELRARFDISQTDLATLFEDITGKPHGRNWLSDRETGKRPFTVSELFILSAVFRVNIGRFFRFNRVDERSITPYRSGIVWIDGLPASVTSFIPDFFTDAENRDAVVASFSHPSDERPAGPVEGRDDPKPMMGDPAGYKRRAEHLRRTRDEWFPERSSVKRAFFETMRAAHRPHPGAGKRYSAWLKRRDALRDPDTRGDG